MKKNKTKLKRAKGMMKENQKQRHKQTKQTPPTRTQKNDQSHDKRLKYLLQKKNSIAKNDRKGPVVKMADFGPFGVKIVFLSLASLALHLQGFQPKSVDFVNPFWEKYRRAKNKHKKFIGQAQEGKIWSFFQDPHFEVRMAI